MSRSRLLVLVLAVGCVGGRSPGGDEPVAAPSPGIPVAQDAAASEAGPAAEPVLAPEPAMGAASVAVSPPPALDAAAVGAATADESAAPHAPVGGQAAAPLTGALHPEHARELRARFVSIPAAPPGERPGLPAPVFDAARARQASLELRATRRAYEGAPPAVPHSLGYGGQMPCLTCHETGVVIGEKVARPMSHPPMTNCTQCHVGPSDRAFAGLSPALDAFNAFEGRGPPGAGGRAHELAPPVMPHGVLLRGRCLSCHGEYGYAGLRTEHPLRAQCTQCHLAPAAFDALAPVFGDALAR